MKKYYLICMIFLGLLKANQYDYLLFSHVLSDVESGIELKADVNSRWKESTPLYEAVKNNRLEIAYILIMAGADVNTLSNGETALHKAAQNKNPYMVKLLIMAGANPNIKEKQYDNTPLHYAAMNNDSQSINILTSAGANVTTQNMQGISPAQIAVAEIIIPPIILEDLNLAVSASAFKVASGSVIFNVRNLTNNPLTIFVTDLYINGHLTSSQRYPLTIPPSTTITNVNAMSISPNGMYAIKPDKNGQADIKAGFSIEYEAEGRPQRLFNSTQMKLQLWNPQTQSASTKDTKETQQDDTQDSE
ncbi:hypothetical protein CQA53_01455 [Helicobacter didelphidarum]|uniref:Uncharacterized protein n=1 Tax=Helicobacter didelphidarum TaxID=2040648 RepID=A0A3D8IRG7_9HELI|nr:ankyrin repeat domain-containing protein [Helicobacter didelphidarum]RDU67693.1 hypothetical protein CQA53_01455 [Helicobacter didelphidarum]